MPAYFSRPTAYSILTVFLFLFSDAPASAATCVPATADGAGLQTCLDSTAPGDTVLLSPGTYIPTNSIFFPPPEGSMFGIFKNLTIKGSAPGVVLSGDLGGGDKAFNVVGIDATGSPGPVTLENLTIEGGDSSVGGFLVGGGIVAADNQTVILNNVTIKNNAAFAGGGIWTGESVWTIHNSEFVSNTAVSGFFGTLAGGAIGAIGTQLLVVDGSEFVGNSAPNGYGGAVHFFSGGSLQVSNTAFANNSADESGGALSISAVGFGESYVIENCTFADNVAFDDDEGEGFGGAIDIFSIVGDGQITDSAFYGNGATFGGGAVYITHGRATIVGSTFFENSSGITGGAVVVQGDGSGVRNTNITLDKNTFTNNTSQNGGALFAFDISGGSGSSLTLIKNHYRRNNADFAGAVLVTGFFSVVENLTMLKEHFDFNWSASSIGGLGLKDIVSGSIDKLHFNHNDANEAPHSLGIDLSPNLNIGKIKVAGEDDNDCLINGDSNCP